MASIQPLPLIGVRLRGVDLPRPALVGEAVRDPQRNWSVHRSSPGLLRDHLSIASSARASTDGGMARPAISGRSAINDEMAQFDFCGAPFGVQ